jgi:phenylacetate-CoA ligase
MSFTPIDKFSVQQIQAFQEEKLKSLLLYLQQHSPYYQKLFSENNIAIKEINSLEKLSQIPTTSKQQFAENNFDFLCVPKSKIADYCTTSGTTGSPVTIALTENDLERLAYNEAESFITAGCKKGDVFQLMLTMDRQFMAGMAYYSGIRKIGGATIRTGAVSPQLQWESIERYKPNVLVAVPSFLLKMIDYAEANNIALNASGIERVICIGEPLRNADLSPNQLAERIEAKWKVKLLSTYASTEMQTAFTECEHQNGNHLRPELLIAEILDDEGNQLPPKTLGDLTITTLDVEGMPLLRYRTGDVCMYYNEPCACGRNSIRLSPIVGRKNQMIKYKGTTLFPAAIFDALSALKEVSDYVIQVSKNEIGNDDLLIHLVLNSNQENIISKIAEALQAKLRVTPALNLSSQQHLQSLRPTESRKLVKIIFTNQSL